MRKFPPGACSLPRCRHMPTTLVAAGGRSRRLRLFRLVQTCAGRLGATAFSPLKGAFPAAWQSQFRGNPGLGQQLTRMSRVLENHHGD